MDDFDRNYGAILNVGGVEGAVGVVPADGGGAPAGLHGVTEDGVRHAYRIPKAGAVPLGIQQTSHLQLRLVKLRFRVADGAVQQFGDLAMLIPVNFMKTKDLSAACRERLDRPVE